MTRTSVVIPIRGLHGGKSRLSTLLNPSERAMLIASMATGVIDAVKESEVAESILVVSREPDLFHHLGASTRDVTLLLQSDQSIGLNQAIDLGRRAALERDAERMLILSADMPLLTARAVSKFLRQDATTDVVLGTDGAGLGTNALVLQGRTVISRFTFHFGVDSRRLHREEAGRIGASYRERCTREIALDLDTPDDWTMLSEEMRRQLLIPTIAPRQPSIGAARTAPVAVLERA
ncbi:MAG: 2-phospho-L-lactate guanylyltransferase [Chloroflexia bacterium]|nr:2-phospho-L-lactate guanylyltransferase [Chloroflexia bacterium]